jgi:hypothetical protein
LKWNNHMMQKLLYRLAWILTLNPISSYAQDFSYVYIQGDKKTPLYVKVEGEMAPRYGKNYALLSRLAPGPLNIDILFQQNEYPPLHFTVMVPENGQRAFMVNKKGDNFTLYDLEQHFDLKPDNDISDDHLPKEINNRTIAAAIPAETPASPEIPDTAAEQGNIKVWEDPAEKSPEEKQMKPATRTADTPAAGNASPGFIDHITFDNEQNRNPGNTTTPAKGDTDNNSNSTAEIRNSDCESVIAADAFNRLYHLITAKHTEEERLGLFLEALKQNCFSTAMTGKVVTLLTTDAARFSALKNAYPKITDQSGFATLGAMLAEEEWKAYFDDMVQK